MPKPFPKEFRDDVVRVAQNRDPGITLAQIAKDFGVHVGTLDKWIRQAQAGQGDHVGTAGPRRLVHRGRQARCDPARVHR